MQAHLFPRFLPNVAMHGGLQGEASAYLISANLLLYFIPCSCAQRLLQWV